MKVFTWNVLHRVHGEGHGEEAVVQLADEARRVREVVARVRSLLRRQAGTKATVLTHRGLRLDLLGRELRVEGERVELTSREFALVELLVQNAGRVLTRTQIAERVWEASYDLETNLIDVYVRRLRAKLERPGQPALIGTVRGTGYQLLP